MSKEKYGFVYIWYNKARKMYYLGSHWGTEDDEYICSSTWMRNEYNRHKADFKRRIIKSNIKSVKENFEEELKWLSFIKKEELGKKYYNRCNKFNYCKRKSPKGWSEESKQKMKGKIPWNKGIPMSEEHKEKIRLSHLGITHTKKRQFHNLSDNHKDNIRNALKETLANKYPIENRYKPEFERGTQEWKDKISKTASQYMWITDGAVDKRVKNNTIIENVWRRGRKNKNNK
jgi:predicted adenine nucleotide alpha hydrolase (AANH) superfamily ATPase